MAISPSHNLLPAAASNPIPLAAQSNSASASVPLSASLAAEASSSAALAASVPAATGSAVGPVGAFGSGLSWLKQGRSLPLIPEAKEALQKGIFKETRFYLPQPITMHNITSNQNKLDFEFHDGKLVAKPSHVTGRISSFAELKRAHHDGIIPCLTSLGDLHRLTEYTQLWSFVSDLHERNVLDDDIFVFYESMRYNHPGVNDRVGQLDPEVFGQLTIAMAVAARSATGASSSSSSSASSSSSPSRSRSTSGSGSGTGRQKVCIPFNDLKCTSSTCPKGLPHLCCRCFEPHAASKCHLPDPRKGQSAGSKRGGKFGSGSKSTPSGSD